MMWINTQRQKIEQLYREYPGPFKTLVLVTFIDRLGGALLFPFFALYITKRFGVGMTEVGIIFAAFSFSSFVGSLLGGALTDRLGRKWVIIFSLVTTSLSSVIMGLVNSLQTFFVLALLVGIFTDTGGPAYQAVVADLLPEEKRVQGYGLIRIAFNVSAAIGPAIGGFIAARSYMILFIADAVISLIAATLVLIYMPETRPERRPGAPAESVAASFGGYLRVLKDKFFMAFIGVCILAVLVYTNMTSTLGVYMRDIRAIPESGYGLMLSLNAVMVVIFQLPITRRIEKYPPMLMMALGTLLYAVGFAMYGFISLYILFLIAMAIITVGEMLIAPVSQALTARLAPEDMRGRYMAIFGFSYVIPFAVGPYLGGLVLDNLNPLWLWYACGVVGLVAAWAFLILHRQIRPAAAVAPQAGA
jgi:MFS family permease